MACSNWTLGSARSSNRAWPLAVRYFHHLRRSLNMAPMLRLDGSSLDRVSHYVDRVSRPEEKKVGPRFRRTLRPCRPIGLCLTGIAVGTNSRAGFNVASSRGTSSCGAGPRQSLVWPRRRCCGRGGPAARAAWALTYDEGGGYFDHVPPPL